MSKQYFTSKAVSTICAENGIILDPSTKYKSSSNGQAEAHIKLLSHGALSSLTAAKIHHSLYPFAWNHATAVHYAVLRPPSDMSPDHIISGADAIAFRTFGNGGFI